MMMSPRYIPNDLVVDILSLLPIREKDKFKCVSKEWLEILKTFKWYLPKSMPEASLVYRTTKGNKYFLCSSHSDSPEKQVELHHPFQKKRKYILVGIFKGTVCLVEYVIDGVFNFWLWDTDNNRQRRVPGPGSFDNFIRMSCGVGGRSDVKECKMVCVLYTWARGTIFVYSNEAWRRLEDDISYRIENLPNVVLNGNPHWIGSSGTESLILCFNLKSEKFEKLQMPSDIKPNNVSVTKLNNFLCLCDFVPREKVSIWCMKEYGTFGSWTREFVIELPEDILFDRFDDISILKTGHFLLQNYARMILFDPDAKSVQSKSCFQEEAETDEDHLLPGVSTYVYGKVEAERRI